jgi:hypothetical protein
MTVVEISKPMSAVECNLEYYGQDGQKEGMTLYQKIMVGLGVAGLLLKIAEMIWG